MTQLTRKRILLVGLEATYNDGATALTAGNMLQVSEPSITPIEANDVERTNTQSYLGSYPKQLAGKRVTVSFKCELRGSGVAGTAPPYSPLLKACGFGETVSAAGAAAAAKHVTYNPKSDAIDSAAIWFYNDGSLHKISGARGTFTIESTADNIVYLSFTFTGLFNPPTANIAPVGANPVLPSPVLAEKGSVAFTIHGHVAALSSFSVDVGNSVDYLAYQTEKKITISDRKSVGSITIESPSLGTKDYFAQAVGHKLEAMSWKLGSQAGNIVEITAPKVQIDKPAYGDISGIVSLELPLILTPDAGNDELSIKLT